MAQRRKRIAPFELRLVWFDARVGGIRLRLSRPTRWHYV